MTLVGLAANDLTILAVGFGLLYALGLARSRADVRLVGVAYLAGWALLGTVLSLLLIAGVAVGLATILIAAALVTAALAAAGRRVTARVERRAVPTRHSLGRVVISVTGALIVLEAVAAFVVSLTNWDPDEDVILFWGPRAAIVYFRHGLDPSSWGTFLHPEYPPLGPAMNAATFHFAGGFHPSLLAFQQTLLGIAFLAGALVLLDRHVPRWISLPSLALLVTTSWFWWRLQTILPDQTLGYLIALGALAALLWLCERSRAWLVLATVLLVAASLLKLEGSLFGTLLALAVISASFALYGRAGAISLVLAAGPLAIVPWRLWLAHNGLRTSAADYSISDLLRPGYLADRTSRLHAAIGGLLHAAGDFEAQAIMGIAVVAVVAVASRAPVIAAVVAGWLALAVVGLVSIYWIGRLPISFYLETSDARVGATILIVAATSTPLLLGLGLRSPAGAQSSRVRE